MFYGTVLGVLTVLNLLDLGFGEYPGRGYLADSFGRAAADLAAAGALAHALLLPRRAGTCPASIIAKDLKVPAALDGRPWAEGLRSAQGAPVWPMRAFRDRFLTAYGSTPQPRSTGLWATSRAGRRVAGG